MQEPKWRRRSAERPAEIAAAAAAVFAEQGFAAARMTDIAARAGVSKAALYRYYPAKEALFREVVRQRGPDVGTLVQAMSRSDDLAQVVPALLAAMAEVLERREVRELALMVIAESGKFPELAAVWHEQVIAPALGSLADAIGRGQAKGQVRAGDPHLLAMSVAGPMLMGAVWRQVVEPVGGAPVDLRRLAAEHAAAVLGGLSRS